ncbi:MAG TPA: spheroidene monooxygenase [Rhodobacteraceae bacterium]|jgi:spheroidene monooxygenase|nr:spheroidene monooxygenase [Paracoccaceae bacterium]HBG98500.1 spheroidene monooxygenase [Paracoccaceae bacterium]
MQTVSFSFFRFDTIGARAWAFSMMGFARPMMRRIPDLQFWKLCGSGVGEGFTPIPNTAVYAVLATWPDKATAQARIAEYKPFTLYRDKAVETLTVYLEATSARGEWSGVAPFQPKGALGDGPVAALTRATVKPKVAAQFWRRVPDISAVVGKDPNVRFKIGVGEVPLVQQVTFSIWPDVPTMNAFARTGPHGEAIKAVREGKWFREELYARFRVVGIEGTWEGREPLRDLPGAPQDSEPEAIPA